MLRSLLQDPSAHNVMFVTRDGGSSSGNKAVTYNSAVFRAMFSDNVYTSGEMEITLNSISECRDFTSLLSYIYTSKVTVSSVTCLDMLGPAMCFNSRSLHW